MDREIYDLLRAKCLDLEQCTRFVPDMIYIDIESFKKLTAPLYAQITKNWDKDRQGIYGSIFGIPVYVLDVDKTIIDVAYSVGGLK